MIWSTYRVCPWKFGYVQQTTQEWLLEKGPFIDTYAVSTRINLENEASSKDHQFRVAPNPLETMPKSIPWLFAHLSARRFSPALAQVPKSK